MKSLEKEELKQALIKCWMSHDAMWSALGVRLVRQGTLAQGCARCDFRFGGKAPAED